MSVRLHVYHFTFAQQCIVYMILLPQPQSIRYSIIYLYIFHMIYAGGSENGVTPISLALFNRIAALSKSSSVETASRPFDLNRDGFVMGEGAAVVVLESLEHALARGANIVCEVVGYGMSGSVYACMYVNI
jgi:hypothetical protein